MCLGKINSEECCWQWGGVSVEPFLEKTFLCLTYLLFQSLPVAENPLPGWFGSLWMESSDLRMISSSLHAGSGRRVADSHRFHLTMTFSPLKSPFTAYKSSELKRWQCQVHPVRSEFIKHFARSYTTVLFLLTCPKITCPTDTRWHITKLRVMRCLCAGQDDKFADTSILAPNNFPILLSKPKYVKVKRRYLPHWMLRENTSTVLALRAVGTKLAWNSSPHWYVPVRNWSATPGNRHVSIWTEKWKEMQY